MKQNKEFEHGYQMGYLWRKYEGGSIYKIRATLYDRGIGINTTYAAGFKKGVIDAIKNKMPAYGNIN